MKKLRFHKTKLKKVKHKVQDTNNISKESIEDRKGMIIT